jgi:hypothetical protein
MGYAAVWLAAAAVGRAEPWQVSRRIGDFDRLHLAQPENEYAVRKLNALKSDTMYNSGSAEWDFEVPATGWYELRVAPEPGLNTFVVDGALTLVAGEGRRAAGAPDGKVDNVWLTQGRHTLRIQRDIWWGFWPPPTQATVRAAGEGLEQRVRVEYPGWPGEPVLRRGAGLAIAFQAAGLPEQPRRLRAQLVEDTPAGAVAAKVAVELPAGGELRTVTVELPCPRAGVFLTRFLNGERTIPAADWKTTRVHVVDTTPVAEAGGELRRTLLKEIDCAALAPQWSAGGETTVVAKPFGRYRLSGDVGFLPAQHHGEQESWFAYQLPAQPGSAHVLEVDYPDDDNRTFVIAIRESAPDVYPVAAGVDSGGPWRPTRAMQTQSVLFWPQTDAPRVAFLPPHHGTRAAAARIRIYRVDGEIPLLDTPIEGGRTFANWYEEGENFAGFYSGKKGSLETLRPSADMWPRALRYMGGNLLLPTVSIYQMSLIPSAFNRSFAEPALSDTARLLLLHAEKYGCGMAIEFHPEARELEGPADLKAKRPNALVSRTGQWALYPNTPRHHPLHPENQAWYLAMLGEAADRYADSPSFRGLSLRCMTWANPALNNFHSLDWGYDDTTIGLFERQTGLDVAAPPLGDDRFAKRYDWLMQHAREKWIAWRCEQIADLHRRAAARVRQARPDLKLYLTVFTDMGREAGLDPALLAAVPGVELIYAAHAYGRQPRSYLGFYSEHELRDALIDPARLSGLRSDGRPGSFLFGAAYFEATERVLKPAAIGLAADAKPTWISGVANPAGRHYLERYALALAESDARLLADGGNTYTLGQPLLREFMREYRRLPDVPFAPRADARDPVAVWEKDSVQCSVYGVQAPTEHFLFYAVNRERYPVSVTVQLEAKGPVRGLGTGREAAIKDGRLTCELQSFQLLAFAAPQGSRIVRVETRVPEAERQTVAAMVQAAEALRAEVAAGGQALPPEGRAALDAACAEARQALDQGRLWRARTALESARLARLVYNETLITPPGLEFLLEPAKARLRAVRAQPKPGGFLARLAFEELADNRTPVAGPLRLEAVCEGGCALADGRYGKAIRLDGKSGRVTLQGADAARLAPTNLTLTAWVKPDAVANRSGIAQRQNWPAGYALFIWNGSVAAEAGEKGEPARCRTGDSLLQPGAWRHVALTVASGQTIEIFVDGSSVKRETTQHALGVSSDAFRIGWNGWGGIQNDSSPGRFAGCIDEVKVFDRVLTADEILAEVAGRER